MTVGEIRAALVALIARIDGAQLVTNSAPAGRVLQAPSPQTGTTVQQVQVAGWQVKQSKAGNPYGRLTTNTGAIYPVFERKVLALDPIAVGSVVELTTQAGVDKEGKPFEKVVALRVMQAGALSADNDELPF
jgi:hypothetical protein